MSHAETAARSAGAGDAGLVFEIDAATELSPAWLRITNPTERAVQFRHASPGVVTSGDNVFDLNAPLTHGPYDIGPDESYSFMIQPLDSIDAVVRAPDSAAVTDMAFVPTHFNEAAGEGSVMAARQLIS